MIHRLIRVTGRVQGVFFRAWTVEQAKALGIDGWVRNRADGSVEVRAAAPSEQMARFIARLHDGPPAARVDQVSDEDAAAEPFDGFTQRATV